MRSLAPAESISLSWGIVQSDGREPLSRNDDAMIYLPPRSRWAVCLLATLLSLSTVVAQAQVVMLPTQRIFSTSGSVLVPDRGMTHLGSVRWAREGSTTRGVPGLAQLPGVGRLFRNQAFSREMGTSGAAVTVTIIDLHELDQQVLSQARVHLPSPEEQEIARKADFLTRNLARQSATSVPRKPVPSVRPAGVMEIRRQNQVAALQRQQETTEFLLKARQLDMDGKTGVARIYYQMAARRSMGAQQQVILDRLQQINSQRAAAVPEQIGR